MPIIFYTIILNKKIWGKFFSWLSYDSNYSIFSVSWLDTLFTQYYGDTLSNLVNKGNVSYTRRLRENEYYDGHIAWLKDNANNPNITFTLNRKILQK